MQKRIERDIHKLKKNAKNVIINNNVVTCDFIGPKDSEYENGIWKIIIRMPPDYPYKSPSVGFIDKIYHPNIDLRSGSVCLNALNETWSPIYNLSHIYDIFLPQLLLYPNPDDPLNETAARLYVDDKELYTQNIQKYFITKQN